MKSDLMISCTAANKVHSPVETKEKRKWSVTVFKLFFLFNEYIPG